MVTRMAITIVTRREAVESGRKTFYTGRPCANGHLSERVLPSGGCVECRKTTYRSPRVRVSVDAKRCCACGEIKPAESFHKRLASKDGLFGICSDCKNAQDRARHAQKVAAGYRKYIKNAPRTEAELEKERRRAALRRENEGARKAHAEASAKWRRANPDHVKAHRQKRRASLKGAAGTHSGEDIKSLVKKQRGMCAICHQRLRDGYHIDHIVPLALGGGNDRYNIQILCPACNLSKGARHPVEYMQSRGFLI